LPGKIFPVAAQKKGSINHYYLSVEAYLKRVCAGGIRIASHAQASGVAFQISRTGAGAMADNEQADGVAAEGLEATPAPKGKLKLIIAAAGLLVIVGGGATWFFFLRGHGEEMHAEAPPVKPPSFVEVPDMLVNLAGLPGERVQYLKVKVVLEVKEEKQVEAIKPSLPRVTDIFQTYMRELRASDLNGSAGLFRLKEELTKRVNVALAPTPVNAVLFKEIVVQ
jgi:flagellar FliL protein